MKNVILVGGQGLLSECAYYISHDDNVKLKGYMGADGFKPNVNVKIPFLGFIEDYEIQADDTFLITVGNIKVKQNIYNKLKSRNANFYNLLYNSKINESITIGEGNIFVNCDLTVNIKIGNCNLFNNRVIIGHDAQIGDFNLVAPCTQILGHTIIGSFNSIGTLSCILPNAKIGNNNVIAPGSFIYKLCKNNSYYAGNPALKIGDI